MTDLPDDILAAVVRISASSPPDDEALPDDIRDAVARIAATDLDCVEADATDLQAAIDFAVKRVDGRCYLCWGSLYETQQGPRCLEHNMTPQPPQSSPPSSPLPPVSKLADAISRISGAGVPRAHVSMLDPFALASPTITLTRDQRDAVSRVVAWRVDPTGPRFLSLTGAAGTGKSTLMAAIRERLRGTRTAWSAMTGKAALRMREAAGVHARTFHGVVFHPPREVDNEVEQKIDLEFEAVKAEGLGCLLVVDESSMLGCKLRADVERSAYDKVLFVGDFFQLPPVLSKAEEETVGADYSVFSDTPGPVLTQVMRSSGAVLRAATHVRERHEIPRDSSTEGGSDYRYQETDRPQDAVGLAVQAYLDDPVEHCLVTWRNDVRMTASLAIRSLLGIDDALPQRGEPMVIRRNVYGTDLMNGDAVLFDGWGAPGPDLAGVATRYAAVRSNGGAGQVVELLVPTGHFDGSMPYVPLQVWRKAVREAEVDDPTPLTWGYCLTGHMIQGSEARRVTTFLPGDLSNPHFKKMTKLPGGEEMRFSLRFLYTALARAKQSTSLIVSR